MLPILEHLVILKKEKTSKNITALPTLFLLLPLLDFVGNKAKGRISKRGLQENKARKIF